MSPSRRTSALICSAECGRRDRSYEGIGDFHAAIKVYANLSDASVQASQERRAFTGEKSTNMRSKQASHKTNINGPLWVIRDELNRQQVARMSAAICGSRGNDEDPGYRYAHPGYGAVVIPSASPRRPAVGWAKRQRAHHQETRSMTDGGHVADAPLPTLRGRAHHRIDQQSREQQQPRIAVGIEHAPA